MSQELSHETLDYIKLAIAKANLLDVIVEQGYILQSTLDKCMTQLDEIDQEVLKDDQ